MRWSGPGLAIPFPSNLCPSSLPVAWFAHFMNQNVSMAGIPLSIRPAHRPRAVLPPWTYHQHQWPWRQEAYACVRTLKNDIHVLASVAHTRPLTLSASQLSDHRLAVKVATSSFSLTHACRCCQETKRKFEALCDDDHQNSQRHLPRVWET